jgi:hypothetical protein
MADGDPLRRGTMTRLLTKAFKEASRLSEEAQDEIAVRLLEEIEGEERWDETLARTPDVLERLADKALEDFKAGRTKKLGFDDL